MPTRLAQLKQSAMESARYQGHVMTRFQAHGPRSKPSTERFTAVCKQCGASVTVDLNPPLNGIDIGGEAVAVSCRDTALDQYLTDKDVDRGRPFGYRDDYKRAAAMERYLDEQGITDTAMPTVTQLDAAFAATEG